MKAVKDEGFDVNAIVEQLPKEEAKEKKEDYRNNGEGLALVVYENHTYYQLEEDHGLLNEEYDYVPGGEKDWYRRGSPSAPSGLIKDNGRRFNTRHGNDSIFIKYGIFERTIWQEIFYRKGGGDYLKTVNWIKENYPDTYKKWKDQSVEEDFKEFKEEKIESEEEKKVFEFVEKNLKYKIPKDLIGLMARELAKDSPYINQESLFYTLIMAYLGNIISHRFALGNKELTSNNLLCLVGPSGAGKSTVLNPFLSYAKEHPIFVNSLSNFSAQSARAFFETFENTGRPLWICHEISRYFPGEKNKTSPLKGIDIEIYDKFYDGKGLQAYTIAGNSYGVCYSPRLTLIGCITDYSFKETFSAKVLNEGWLRRGLFFFMPSSNLKSNLDPYEYNDPSIEFSSFAKSILNELVSICIPFGMSKLDISTRRIRIPGGKGTTAHRETVDYFPFTQIKTEREANKVLNIFRQELEDLKLDTKSESVKVMLSTVPEIAQKFALIYCVMRNLEGKKLEAIPEEPPCDILAEGETKIPAPKQEKKLNGNFEIEQSDMEMGVEYAAHLFSQAVIKIVKIDAIIETVEKEKSEMLQELLSEKEKYFLKYQDKTEVPMRSLNKIRLKILRRGMSVEDFLIKNEVKFEVKITRGKTQYILSK